MSKRTIKTIFTLILSIVMVIAIFLSYITYDKRFFENYKYETGGVFSSTRELIIKPVDKEISMKFITNKEGKILRKAPYDRNAEIGLETKDGPLTLGDTEFSPDEDFKNLRLLTKKMPINDEKILTEENYELSQKIILERLKKTGIKDFDIKTDSETGDIVLRFSDINESESEKLEKVKRVIETRGEFTVMDSKTGKVYLDNNHIKKLTPYQHQTAGIVLEFQFNDEGKAILEDITGKYVKRDKDLTEKELAKLAAEAEANDEELDISETAALYMTVDEKPISMGAFEEAITSGTLTTPLSQDTSKMTEKELEEALEETEELAAIIRAGTEPIRYEIFKETRLVSPMDKTNIIILLSIIGLIVIGLLIVSIVLYRLNGVLGWYMSLVFLLIVFAMFKYTNIAITIPSIIALTLIYLIEYVFTLYALKDLKNFGETSVSKNMFIITKNTILIIIAGLLLTFAKDTNLSSFGQMICLGEILLIIYNAIFAKNILR